MKRIEIVYEVTGDLASLDLGEWPTPLSVFFPEGSRCEQLNYGQGEGQVDIDGEEWGFYWSPHGSLRVVRHEGLRSVEQTQEVMTRIRARLAERLRGEVTFRLSSVSEEAPFDPPA
ncbi:hypothetical protein LZ198_23335 [Myxococcus sp. K15C18031901]|uniref:hypothetical protein n=1 Tax=Myxococcus dinghuensis TaxID=2906761 RepID=UPI0020A7115F|nr:hypothetical protein [Myxococcus dinghuensis]MCP3101814.1 hypothetical protein [Myxococcus dinghuensis]